MPSITKRSATAAKVLKAYRWQYIVSGVSERFVGVLKELLDEAQLGRVVAGLAPLVEHATPASPRA